MSICLAPIVVFAFNRLDALKNTIESLKTNAEAAKSNLFIFVDGHRADKEGEAEKVRAVQEYVKTIKGFRNVTWRFAVKNKGLAASVISGTTEVIEKYDKVIVVEDDLIFSENFLSFMNQGLKHYEHESKVFSICGYSNKIEVPAYYHYDAYFCTRSSSWGWATWKDRWNSVDWNLEDWDSYRHHARSFNRWGGSDCWKMLNDWHNGRNKSWAIRFCFSQFLQNRWSLFPLKILVENNGFDGLGTNCKKWSRFKCEVDYSGQKTFKWPNEIVVNRTLHKEAMRYHSIGIRVWSKLMYWINR